MKNAHKRHSVGVAARFVDERLAEGRVFFSFAELLAKTGLSEIAAKHQLLRLGNKIARVTPRQQSFLIVPPEYRTFGAPPIEWWLDDYMRQLGHPYYLALLSAAALFGSSPQAVQETQVMTDASRRDIVLGRIRVRFFMKSGIGRTLVAQAPSAYAPLTVSTVESTIVDLIRYAPQLGGIERMAETIAPMIARAKPGAFRRVLDAEQEVATVQRLGFVLEAIGAAKLVEVAWKWLPARLPPTVLSAQGGGREAAPMHPKWHVVNNSDAFA
ncbi:MAG: hypothetical protein M0T84_06545 [Betaproteobacteria bacterium]|nr:hypothetical protein [Betaproteobacteria bacterium]